MEPIVLDEKYLDLWERFTKETQDENGRRMEEAWEEHRKYLDDWKKHQEKLDETSKARMWNFPNIMVQNFPPLEDVSVENFLHWLVKHRKAE